MIGGDDLGANVVMLMLTLLILFLLSLLHRNLIFFCPTMVMALILLIFPRRRQDLPQDRWDPLRIMCQALTLILLSLLATRRLPVRRCRLRQIPWDP
jgi:hypothetical protein